MLQRCRRGPGRRRLRTYATSRAQGLRAALQAEVTAWLGQDFEEGELHPQCLKDFDRAEFIVGPAIFPQGAAALAGDKARSETAFIESIRRECGIPGGDIRLVWVVSALASQIVMAHLGTVCFSGPHSYSFPGGCVKASYRVQRCGNAVRLSITRVIEGFKTFALADGEDFACHPSSFAHQKAELVVRSAAGSSVVIEVLDVLEEMRLIWPNQMIVVHDDLPLDFRSPPAFSSSVSSLWQCIGSAVTAPIHMLFVMLQPLWQRLESALRPVAHKKHTA
mmetsp:Transcript_57092/g.133111  ORF Transcript_57092/g.133111 Transcript_57092/m.133111 type:complete len:278 (+) Transcript_57092:75-908(+)